MDEAEKDGREPGAKFKIRFMQAVDLSRYSTDDADDMALVGRIAEDIRAEIQREVNRLVAARTSVWFG